MAAPITDYSTPQTRADLLSLSDERDRYLLRMLAAERAAYRQGCRDGYERGYLAAVAAIKAVERDTVTSLRGHVTTWGKGGRTRFADPRPGDYLGQSAGTVPGDSADGAR